MGKSSAFLGTITIIAVALLVLLGITSLPNNAQKTDLKPTNNPTETPITPRSDFGNPSLGPSEADLTIFVFGDYQCIACAQVEPNLIEAVTAYPDRIRLVWKDLPNIQIHPDAMNAAVAARCAGEQGDFWHYHDLLMANQSSLNESNFQLFATEDGLDVEKFSSCYSSRLTEPLVKRDVEEAISLGIDATPYFFVGNTRLSGAISVERLRNMIDLELARGSSK
ncbi:hypothetical protein A2480_02700 [Candidatus Uhrbacteria bacterium RIFOXYC2_FULL_47_19]|uniref:Thioredoxin domain-containing protein n=1 Tax=Candidatus Uhrbacteria bacterium RIFOXYC2_FULL_47_19 TaxID=1802424 RepID=A0A1F7WD44_9BACT|nr:MAG: hypothetical protein A2480_02700 [Candidatus Uhrbacteria bacterium RIFOXYC2_FULL_47_19]HCC21915.1 hypothetical protein [Candidatus Uhrbacteria bacterium]